MPETAGELVASSGEVIGRHEGIHNFTVGQRKGLGVASPSPLYVINIDPASHRVTVGADAELATRTSARAATELDQHCGADGADAGEGEDPASARAGVGDAGAGRSGRSDWRHSMSRSAQ